MGRQKRARRYGKGGTAEGRCQIQGDGWWRRGVHGLCRTKAAHVKTRVRVTDSTIIIQIIAIVCFRTPYRERRKTF